MVKDNIKCPQCGCYVSVKLQYCWVCKFKLTSYSTCKHEHEKINDKHMLNKGEIVWSLDFNQPVMIETICDYGYEISSYRDYIFMGVFSHTKLNKVGRFNIFEWFTFYHNNDYHILWYNEDGMLTISSFNNTDENTFTSDFAERIINEFAYKHALKIFPQKWIDKVDMYPEPVPPPEYY